MTSSTRLRGVQLGKLRWEAASGALAIAGLALGVLGTQASGQTAFAPDGGNEVLPAPQPQLLSTFGPPALWLEQPSTPSTPTRIPFLPRGGNTVYSRTVNSGFIFNWPLQGFNQNTGPDWDIFWDDINIPVQNLQLPSGGGTAALLDVCSVQLFIRSAGSATAGSVKFYWTTMNQDNLASPLPGVAIWQGLPGINVPGNLITSAAYPDGIIPIPANTAAGGVSRFVEIGTAGGPTLFTVPLDLSFATTNGQPLVYGSFALGSKVVTGRGNATNTAGHTLRLTSSPATEDGGGFSFDNCWFEDPTPPAAPPGGPTNLGPWGFTNTTERTHTPNLSVGAIVKGTVRPVTTPAVCCIPGLLFPVCFVAADASNCVQSGGTTVPSEGGACTPTSCAVVRCCNQITGVQTTGFASVGCPGTTVQVCNGTPCDQLRAPLNDECAGAGPSSAYSLQFGPGSTSTPTRGGQSLVSATASFTQQVTGTFTNVDVWYLLVLTPAQAADTVNYPAFNIVYDSVAGVPGFTPQGASLAVFDGGSVAGAPECPTDPTSRIAVLDVNLGLPPYHQTLVFTNNGSSLYYYIRVAYFDPGQARFSIRVDRASTQACCNTSSGTCQLSDSNGVCPGTHPLATGANACGAGVCAQGACCSTTTGACTVTGPDGCSGANQSYFAGQASGSACAAANLCSGACCNTTTGGCTLIASAAAATQCAAPNFYRGDITVCTPNACGGACCDTNTGACTLVYAANAATACLSPLVYVGDASVCSPNNPCFVPCCMADGSCAFKAANTCTGVAGLLGTVCGRPVNANDLPVPNPCDQTAVAAPGNDNCANPVSLTVDAGTLGTLAVVKASTSASLAFVAGPPATITRTAGSFVTDGYVVGDKVTTSGFTNAANNGTFTVTAVVALTLTLAETTPVAEAAGTRAIAANAKITRTAGSFVTDGHLAGDTLTTSGFANSANNGTFHTAAVAALTLILQETSLTSEAAGALRGAFRHTAGNTFGATQDAAPACTGTTLDVWYRFTAVAGKHYKVTAINGYQARMSIATYDNAAGCPGTEEYCAGALLNPSTANIPPRPTNEDVRVRLASFAGESAPFTVLVQNIKIGACCQLVLCLLSNEQGACASGYTYRGEGTACSPSNACLENGACCNPHSGQCFSATPGLPATCECDAIYQGANTVCSPNPCPQPSFVCCRGATCFSSATITTLVDCQAGLGAALAGATLTAYDHCNPAAGAGSTSVPCCYADYNKSGGIAVQDIFDYLNDWFASRPFAKVGGDGQPGAVLTIDDIFAYLNAWFAGC